ncbi:hypothetical protein O4H49_16270 [Kiloniella laminariae]|uniref:Uncharacterized protein n=1 Tax=Kiloniella laminariae TaxID=454162 RepID=A0ABT4LML0_9PROT|nr:hypothetical protein [Kiloniella laminariae]MCZ4282343.1 hypothetical protein [Kiloniella laminariae]
MSLAKKRGMICRDHPDLSTRRQYKLVRLSRSAIYYNPVGIDADTLTVMKAGDQVFTGYLFFGSRQIATSLRRRGCRYHPASQRLMRLMGLQERIY